MEGEGLIHIAVILESGESFKRIWGPQQCDATVRTQQTCVSANLHIVAPTRVCLTVIVHSGKGEEFQ